MDHGEASINTICHDQLRKLSINLKSIIHLVYGSSNVSNTTTSIVCFCRLLSHLTESHITIFNLWIFVINMYQLCCNFNFFFYCSGFCHTLKWNSHGFTCAPHPDPPSHLPLHGCYKIFVAIFCLLSVLILYFLWY